MLRTRKQQRQDIVKKVALGAAVSAAAAYVAGVLTAPKSGKETREDLKDKAIETYNLSEKELKKLHTELSDIIGETSDRLNNFKNRKEVERMLMKGQDAKQKAREMLSHLHEGGSEIADDKELKKAIQDATKAVQHLRDYLKK